MMIQRVLPAPSEGYDPIMKRAHEILLVDDEPNIRELVAIILKSKGYHVTKASNGERALEALNNKHFDVVITDLGMPGTNGFGVLRHAKALNPDTVVILFTGNNDADVVIDALRLRADDYLLKPCNPDELCLCVSNAIAELEATRKKEVPDARIRALNGEVITMLMVMSHDIQSPLISMAAIVKLLIRGVYGKMDESVRATVTDLYGRIKRLIGIAEDCLGKTSVVSGEVTMQRKQLDLRGDIIDPVLDELSPEIERRNIVIDNRLGAIPANRIIIKADKIWLKMVFRNLFCNAIKYGDEGCTIAFGFENHGAQYKLNVYNSGEPIPHSCRDKLFDKFWRVDEGSNGNGKGKGTGTGTGTGLGLYLVREIVRKHGGDIWYEAKENGSNFVFTLPCD